MDHSVLGSMKNAASCETWCELQDTLSTDSLNAHCGLGSSLGFVCLRVGSYIKRVAGAQMGGALAARFDRVGVKDSTLNTKVCAEPLRGEKTEKECTCRGVTGFVSETPPRLVPTLALACIGTCRYVRGLDLLGYGSLAVFLLNRDRCLLGTLAE